MIPQFQVLSCQTHPHQQKMEEHPPRCPDAESCANSQQSRTEQASPLSPLLNQTDITEILKHLIQPHYAFSSIRFESFTLTPDGGVSTTGVDIRYNLERSSCRWCKLDFANPTMLEKHNAEDLIHCCVCGIEFYGRCGKYNAHPNKCDKCKECFRCAKDMMKHYEQKGHQQCYWEGCQSQYAAGDWKVSVIQEHMRCRRI